MNARRKSRTSFAVAALGLTLGVFCSGCGTTPGKKIQSAQETSRAEQEPNKLVARGKMFARVGDYTRATQYFERALEGGADPGEVLPLLMRAYVESGRYRLALQLGERHLAKAPRDHRLRFLIATIYVAIDDVDRAHKHLQRVIQDNPSNAEAHYVLAVLLRDRDRDLLGADFHFREYLRLSPTGVHAEEANGALLKPVP